MWPIIFIEGKAKVLYLVQRDTRYWKCTPSSEHSKWSDALKYYVILSTYVYTILDTYYVSDMDFLCNTFLFYCNTIFSTKSQFAKVYQILWWVFNPSN